jgi:protein-arginine kinase activator protein McsA
MEVINKDIDLLKKRLKYLIKYEEYESAAIVKKWIDDLSKKKSKN